MYLCHSNRGNGTTTDSLKFFVGNDILYLQSEKELQVIFPLGMCPLIHLNTEKLYVVLCDAVEGYSH
jgi:hypothetical protein